MNLVELDHALRKLRLSGMAATLETRLLEAQSERRAPVDLVSALIHDELTRRQDRLLARRIQAARFRDPKVSLDGFDFRLQPEDEPAPRLRRRQRPLRRAPRGCPLPRPPGTGKSRLAQAIGLCAIAQGYKVAYHEAHVLLEELADATLDGTRKAYLAARLRSPPHPRRPRHAKAPVHCRRGSPRARHAPLRAGKHATHLEPSRRRLGQAARRHRRHDRHARPPPPPCPHPEMRTQELADEALAAGAGGDATKPEDIFDFEPSRGAGVPEMPPPCDRSSWGIL